MKKISKLLTLALIASVGIFGSCKDYDEDMYQDMTQKSQNLDAKIQKLEAAKATLDEVVNVTLPSLDQRIKALEEAPAPDLSIYALKSEVAASIALLNECDEKLLEMINALSAKEAEDIQNNANAIAQNANDIAAIQGVVNGILELLGDHDGQLTKLAEQLADCQGDAQKALEEIELLKLKDAELEATAGEALTKAGEALTNANLALAIAISNAQYLETVSALLEEYGTSISGLEKDMTALEKTVNTLNNTVKSLKTTLTQQIRNLNAFRDSTVLLLDIARFDIAVVQEQMAAAQADIQTLTEGVEALNEDVNEIRDDISSLASRLNDIEYWRAHQITGIVNQGTFNNLYGYLSTPLGTANMLLALYGDKVAVPGAEFPKAAAAYELHEENAFTKADMDILGVPGIKNKYTFQNDYIAGDNGASAGYIYFTANPADAILYGTDFSLVNSLDEQVYKLQNIVPASSKFTYGANKTRTGISEEAANGLYEAEVVLPLDQLKDNTINFRELKPVLEDVINAIKNRSDIDLSKVVETVHSFLNDAGSKLQANAVKAVWEDNYGIHPVYSKYEYGIAAVKPLGYNFYTDADGNPKSFRIADFLKFAPFAELDYVEIGQIKITLDKVVFDYDENGKFVVFMYDEDGNLVDITEYAIKTMEDQINESMYNNLENIKNGIAKEFSNKFNGTIDDVNSIIGRINNIINKVLNNKWFSAKISPNEWLQPVLFFVDGNGKPQAMSTDKNNPVEIKVTDSKDAGLVLIATSATREAIAPSFKKFIGVTNVFDEAGHSAQDAGDFLLKAAAFDVNSGEDFDCVVDGNQSAFTFIPKKAIRDLDQNYLYEIAYSSVDYSGNSVTNKYYIKLVK